MRGHEHSNYRVRSSVWFLPAQLIRRVREEFSERLSHTWRNVHDDVPAMQLTWMCQSACVGNHLEVAFEGKSVVADPNAFVSWVQPGLKPLILRRHAGRTRVRVATERLNAPDRKQKSTTDMYQVGAECQMRSDVATRRDLARGESR